ncbi:MAG TPA: hypothetical protein VNT99_12840 [Methylomirabilota bacterium]|nr:hypothetical protein [Methylomirabilota bacterium]
MNGMNTEQESEAAGQGTVQSPISPARAQQGGDANAEIVPANLRALEAVYFAAMLEEARVFEVVERLVAMFGQGLLPLGPGKAGATLYRYWKGHHHRLSAAQRHNVYARVFGLPPHDAGVRPNRKFNELWLRFVSIVGMYSAELQMLPPSERSVGPEEVLTSGRDLAVNLSAHGHSLAWFAAQDFKPEVQQTIELLSDPEIQVAFQARDPWQVIQNVAASELNATPNVPRGHTRAECGVIIIRWLSNRRARLLRPRGNVLKHDDICEGRTAASMNKKATVYPTDSDLVTACENWLGVTGTQEAELREQAPLEEHSPAGPLPVPPDNQHEQAA